MNLWAKSLRQLSFVAIALFFFSCEEENTLLGFRNPVPKFNVSYVEIPLTSNVQLIDSIITDNLNGSGNLLIGKYQDNALGTVTAQSFLQIYPSAAARIPADAVFDSVTVSIRFNFYRYGFSGLATHNFQIHELIDSLDRGLVKPKRYYFNNPMLAISSAPLGNLTVKVNSEKLDEQISKPAANQDTVRATAKLAPEFGLKIFKLLQLYPFEKAENLSLNVQYRDFLDKVKGIALIPSESSGVLGFRILNNLTAVTLHYRTVANGVVTDTLSRALAFNLPSFTRIEVDRSGSVLANAQPYQSVGELSTTGTRYVQNGSPVITKLDLGNFYTFADTVGNVLFNEASLVIDGVESEVNTPPINQLTLKALNGNNQFMNYALAATDRVAMTPYTLTSSNLSGVMLLDEKHYLLKSDVPNTAQVASLAYASGRYSGEMTLFLQQLLKHKNVGDAANPTRLRYMGLYPLAPSVSSSVTRTVFPAANVKLRIYYTKPTLTVNP